MDIETFIASKAGKAVTGITVAAAFAVAAYGVSQNRVPAAIRTVASAVGILCATKKICKDQQVLTQQL